MFPDGNHQIGSPKFFTLTLTDAHGVHTYLYNLKFPETFALNAEMKVSVPLVLCIKSNKEDMEPFKELLYAMYQIIVNNDLYTKDYSRDVINNFKKIELLNLFTFCFALIKPSPHSLLKLKLDSHLYNDSLEAMEFYYSSNCEIPCNKDDKDINMLFSILDQSIIVKIIFSILTEKQIIIRASQSFVLHLVFPAFLKLIFPFQWIHSYLPVVPSEQLELLEKPGSYLFGVLSSSITLDGLIQTHPGRVIVDCDTNQIIDNEQYIAPCSGEGLLQGKNTVVVDNEKIYIENKNKRNVSFKDNLTNRGNLIIDCTNDVIYIDRSESYLSVEEWNKFKRKMQLIKNPETFGVENLRKNNKKERRHYNTINHPKDDDDDDNDDECVLPNRSFSYNVQNVFLQMFMEKMRYRNKEFMLMFKSTNLYKIFNEPRKYQNDCGNVVIKNIAMTKNNPRSFMNAFEIEYNMKPFPAKRLLEELIVSKEELTQDEQQQKEHVKEVLCDYCKIRALFSEEALFPSIPNVNTRFTMNVTSSHMMYQSSLVKGGRGRLSVNQKQIKNNSNLLFNNGSNSVYFNVSDKEDDDENEFLFYRDKGFIQFSKKFFDVMERHHVDVDDYVYKRRVVFQIRNLIKNELGLSHIDEGGSPLLLDAKKMNNSNTVAAADLLYANTTSNNNNNNRSSSSNLLYKKMSSKKDIYRISETFDENDNESLNNDYNNDVDSTYNNFLSFSEQDHILTFNNTTNIHDLNEDDTIDHQLQFYLFLAFCLEDIKSSKHHCDKFLNEMVEQLNINELIFSFYQKAFALNDKKEFPYYNLYCFFNSLTYDELSNLELNANHIELREIYNAVLETKESNEKKKRAPLRDMFFLEQPIKTSRSSGKSSKLSTMSSRSNASVGADKVPYSIYIESTDPHYIGVKYKTANSLGGTLSSADKHSISSDDNNNNNNRNSNNLVHIHTTMFKYDEEYKKKIVINDNNTFTPFVEPLSWNIIRELSQLIELSLPDITCTQTKPTELLLEETHDKMTSSAIIELVSELKKIKLQTLNNSKQRIVFWVNCFNYLLLFTIFYNKWYLHNETEWRYFFTNVHFNIGGYEFSFNDMQYILFDKILYLNNSYRPLSYVKEMAVSTALKTEKDKYKKNECIDVSYFCLYLPTKELPGPKIITEEECDCQMLYCSTNYFNGFLFVDAFYNLHIPELVLMVEPQFLGKGLGKYKGCLGSDVYELIENKAYKECVKTKVAWELNFEYLHNQKVERFVNG